jgi:glutathione peroxidase
MPQSLHDFTQKTIDGREQLLADYKGQVLLVVNVASRCGLTPQYAGMQSLHDEYEARGFSVLGFPCNQFAGQEPGSEADIKTFCETRFGVTFPLFAKLDVNGAASAPLYAWLTAQETKPDGPGDVAWNFAKFVVGKDGRVAARFNPRVEATAPEVRAAIDAALAK